MHRGQRETGHYGTAHRAYIDHCQHQNKDTKPAPGHPNN
jgi:hypothetical protein